MSMSTSYRYEVDRPGAQNLRKALKRQEQRIKTRGWLESGDEIPQHSSEKGYANPSCYLTKYSIGAEGSSMFEFHKIITDTLKALLYDEWCSERDAAVNNDILVNQIAEWAEKLEETSEHRKVKRNNEETKSELSLVNKELTDVRKAQLRKLLHEENLMFKQQLNETGKTLYIQRT